MRWALYIPGAGPSALLRVIDIGPWTTIGAQAALVPGAAWVAADGVTLASHYVEAGALVARQSHPDLPTDTVAAGAALGGFPAGATATAFAPGGGDAGSAVIDPDGELVFPAAGIWRVAIAASVTHFARDYLVTVT